MAYVTKGQKADYELVQSRIDGFYPDLVECQFRVGILLVHPSPSNPEKPPLLRNGYPVTGDIKVVSYEDRVQGKPDATLKLEGQNWANIDEESKTGEIDHQLERIIALRDKNTKAIKTDDFGRPKIKLRPADREVSVFDAVVRRHGRNAPEARAVEELSLHYNTLLPVNGNGGEVNEGAEEQPALPNSQNHAQPEQSEEMVKTISAELAKEEEAA